MKKTILLLAISFISLTAMAQAPTFGLRGGINLSTLGGDDVDQDQVKSKIGLNVGAFANFRMSNGFSIQPELSYSQLGAEFENSSTDGKLSMDYITLPILAKYDFTNSGFSLYAGPQVGFLTSAKLKDDNGSTDWKDNVKGSDFAGILGGEYQFTGAPVGVSARYQFGLSSIADNDNTDIKNNGFTFSLFYKFR